MAERRMMSKSITRSDAFLDMPQSTQLLYFHLLSEGDDDGFVNNPNMIMRIVGANKNDMDLLIVKKFVFNFENGVVVIKHWKIHNYIQKDRYRPTKYKEEKSTLFLDENNAYTKTKPNILDTKKQEKLCLDTQCIQDVRLGKVSIGKVSIDNIYICEKILDFWNEKKIIKHKKSDDLIKTIEKSLKKYSESEIIGSIYRYSEVLKSDYYFNHKWSLTAFLKQKNAMPSFLQNGEKWLNYKNDSSSKKNKSNFVEKQISFNDCEELNKDIEI